MKHASSKCFNWWCVDSAILFHCYVFWLFAFAVPQFMRLALCFWWSTFFFLLQALAFSVGFPQDSTPSHSPCKSESHGDSCDGIILVLWGIIPQTGCKLCCMIGKVDTMAIYEQCGTMHCVHWKGRTPADRPLPYIRVIPQCVALDHFVETFLSVAPSHRISVANYLSTSEVCHPYFVEGCCHYMSYLIPATCISYPA